MSQHLSGRIAKYLSPDQLEELLVAAANSSGDTYENGIANWNGRNSLCAAFIAEALSTQQPGSIGAGSTCVPTRIVQFWDESLPPADVLECMETWRAIPGFQYERFNATNALEFLRVQIGDLALRAFNYCHHPAMKCDYFRLAYLRVRGGIYVDADNSFSGKPFRHLVDSGSGLKLQFLCSDPSRGMVTPASVRQHLNANVKEQGPLKFYFNNDPIFVRPDHPVIGKAFAQATTGILDAMRDGRICNIHWVTGPDNLTNALYLVALDALRSGTDLDFSAIADWADVGAQKWALEYRDTDRDWRLGRVIK